MAVGQVAFHNDKRVRAWDLFPPVMSYHHRSREVRLRVQCPLRSAERLLVHVATRENPIVNRLNKTKVEKQVDHEQERIDRVKKENAEKRAIAAQKVDLPVLGSMLVFTFIAEKGRSRVGATEGRGKGCTIIRSVVQRRRGRGRTQVDWQGHRGRFHVVYLLWSIAPVYNQLKSSITQKSQAGARRLCHEHSICCPTSHRCH